MDLVQPPRTPREIQVARDAWRSLGRKGHRDVLRRAKRGEHHPHLHTATTAYRWACTVIPPDETAGERARLYGGAAVAGAALELIFDSLLGGGSGGVATGAAVGGIAGQRRAARKIIRLGPPRAL